MSRRIMTSEEISDLLADVAEVISEEIEDWNITPEGIAEVLYEEGLLTDEV